MICKNDAWSKQGSFLWERLREKVWNNLKCLNRCAFWECTQTALKVWKWSFVKSKIQSEIRLKSELSHPCLRVNNICTKLKEWQQEGHWNYESTSSSSSSDLSSSSSSSKRGPPLYNPHPPPHRPRRLPRAPQKNRRSPSCHWRPSCCSSRPFLSWLSGVAKRSKVIIRIIRTMDSSNWLVLQVVHRPLWQSVTDVVFVCMCVCVCATHVNSVHLRACARTCVCVRTNGQSFSRFEVCINWWSAVFVLICEQSVPWSVCASCILCYVCVR